MSRIKYKIGTECGPYLCRGIYGSDGFPNTCEVYVNGEWKRTDDAWDVMCGWAPGEDVSAKEAKAFMEKAGT